METWYGRENSTAVTPLTMRGERCAAAEQASHESSGAPRLIPERPTASAVPAERCREELRNKGKKGKQATGVLNSENSTPEAADGGGFAPPPPDVRFAAAPGGSDELSSGRSRYYVAFFVLWRREGTQSGQP